MAPAFRIRPSAAPRWVKCGGYVAMTSLYPEQPADNRIRDEGNAFHECMHHKGSGWGDVALGAVLHGIEVDEFMLDCASEAVDHVKGWDCALYFEQTVAAPSIHKDCGGTADIVGIDWRRKIIRILDGKYGYRPVYAYEAPQLGCYLAGVLDSMGIPPNSAFDHEWRVEFTIYQPRTPGNSFDKWVFNLAEEGRSLINTLRAAAERQSPTVEGARLVAGSHCYKCSAAAHCPALRDSALAIVEMAHVYSQARPKDGIDISLHLDVVNGAADILDVYKEALTIEAESMIKDGGFIPGYVMRAGSGRIRWKDSSKSIVTMLAQAQGLGDIAKPTEPIGPRMAEKIVGKEFVALHTETPSGKAKLVRERKSDIASKFMVTL